jgi:uncharacterized protein YciI
VAFLLLYIFSLNSLKKNAQMFIINLNYIVPLEQLDAHMTDHVKFLRKYYKQNVFLASGRKVPRTGGIILALAKSKGEIDQIIREDPFYTHKLAEFSVTEFQASQYHPDLKKILTEK